MKTNSKSPEVRNTTQSRKPCSRKGWCQAMKLVLDGDRESKRAGFQMAFIFKTSGDGVRSVLVYRPMARGSQAIALNVCPWCRVELATVLESPIKPRARKKKDANVTR